MQNDPRIDVIKKWLGTGSINIFGMPFAGKDTHGNELAKYFDAPLIGGGEIIRSKDEHKHIHEHISTGALAPTDEYLKLILPYLSQDKFKNHPLILSSVGRWFGEHDHIIEAAKESGHELKAVLYLEIGLDELYRRWEHSFLLQDRGQRHDDAEHVLEKRIAEFESKTIPVIEYYRQQGLLVEINGKPPRHIVKEEIVEALYQKAISK